MGFLGIGNWKKKRQRYYEEKLRQFGSISDRYGLGLTREDYDRIAWSYADSKAQSEKGFLDSMFSGGNFFTAIITIVITVVTIIYAPYTTYPYLAAMQVVAAVAAGSFTLYSMHFENKMLALAMIAQRLASMIGSQKALTAADEAKDQLTHMLIYQPYEIFANGSIYKSQNAGSQTFSPSIPFDPNKGLLGQYKKIPQDEFMLNRAQVNQGGNAQYATATLNLDFPLASGNFPIEALQDSIENNMRAAIKRITEGFNELNKVFFNFLGTASYFYQKVYKAQIPKYYNRMIMLDFLDKNQNYQKGLMAEIYFLHKKDFEKDRKKSEAEIIEELNEMRQVFQMQQDSNEYTLEEKAYNYYGSVMWLFGFLAGLKTPQSKADQEANKIATPRQVAVYPFATPPIKANYDYYRDPYRAPALKQASEKRYNARLTQINLWQQWLNEPDYKKALSIIQAYNYQQQIIDESNAKITKITTQGQPTMPIVDSDQPQGGFKPTISNTIFTVQIAHLGFNARIQLAQTTTITVGVVDNEPITNSTTIASKPTAQLSIASFFGNLNAKTPREVVDLYHKALKNRIGYTQTEGKATQNTAKTPYLALDYANESLALLKLEPHELSAFDKPLPMHKDLENFDFSVFDNELKDDDNDEA